MELINYEMDVTDLSPGTGTVRKVHGLNLLLRFGTLWKYGDSLSFEVPLFSSDALLTTLHPLLENVLQTVCRKLQEDSGTGSFDLGAPFHGSKSPEIKWGRDLDCVTNVPPISVDASIATFQSRNADAPLKLLRHPKRVLLKRPKLRFREIGGAL
jgi:hypothetical protein